MQWKETIQAHWEIALKKFYTTYLMIVLVFTHIEDAQSVFMGIEMLLVGTQELKWAYLTTKSNGENL